MRTFLAPPWRGALAIAFSITATLTACGGGDDGSTPPATPQVVSVAISAPASSVLVGDQLQLTANVSVLNGASTAVTWSTSDVSVATVSSAGLVQGVSPGSATITAKSTADATKSATQSITVNVRPGVSAIAVTPVNATVNVGGTQALTANVTAVGGASTNVNWTSSNPAIASVNGNGLVTGVAAGSANVTATSVFDATKTAFSVITVVATPSVTSVVVTPSSPPAIVIGGQVTLTATVTALNGASTAVNWTTSNPGVATVSQSGQVTGVGVGSATITATSTFDASKAGTASITVNTAPAVTSVAISNVPSVVVVGTTAQLTATVSTVGGASNAVTWTSSDPALASVSANGLVTALAPGSVTITARSVFDATKSATTSAIRLDAAAIVLSVTVGPASLSLTVGQNGQLSATVSVLNNASTAVLWTSDNNGVATVNSTGRVTAVAAGTARIRATSQVDATKFGESVTTVSSAGFPGSATVNATISSQFTPQVVDIAVLGTVTFTFESLAHDVVFEDAGAPPNIPTSANTSVNRTFNTPGIYNYLCTIHGGMTGTIRVH